MIYEEETLKNVVKDTIDAYMHECVTHFLTQKVHDFEDEARYFYTDKEIFEFMDNFEDEGGKLKDLHIGEIYTDERDWCKREAAGARFFCYEVCRNSAYKSDKANGGKTFIS